MYFYLSLSLSLALNSQFFSMPTSLHFLISAASFPLIHVKQRGGVGCALGRAKDEQRAFWSFHNQDHSLGYAHLGPYFSSKTEIWVVGTISTN